MAERLDHRKLGAILAAEFVGYSRRVAKGELLGEEVIQ